ncbi:hypothetical protein U1Q18_026381 [Sarracenia purpurea var. burkii]
MGFAVARSDIGRLLFLSDNLVRMGDELDAGLPLDYVEFKTFPNQNRYEAFVCIGNKVETIASGILGQLVLHFPELKGLVSSGSNANFKFQPPENLDGSKWFTKLTITRFLHIVGSPDILSTANSLENEIKQLEEAQTFHHYLYTKDHSGDGETDRCSVTGLAPKQKDEVEIVSSDASKNELLHAMTLRLTALRGELAATFNFASPNDITDIEKLSQYFGAIDLRNILRKIVELDQMGHTVDLPSYEKSSSAFDTRKDTVNMAKGNFRISKPSRSDMPIKYGVSPAKVAQVERQSSTESEESSHSSEEDQPSVERSRSLIRSAAPRRSASPMRRIQIGRSGSRRSTALTVKSLCYFPARERILSHRDAMEDSIEEEASDRPPKKSETNAHRISVQDAINLFEGKQRDKTSGIQKRSTLDASGTNKSVLRRWSAGVEENSSIFQEIVSESSVSMISDILEGREIPKGSVEAKSESDFISLDHNPVETAEVDASLDTSEKTISYPIGSQADNLLTQSEDGAEKLIASSEWNQQKEAELNQMLIKMTESKSSRYRNTVTENKRSRDVTHDELRGGFYDHYKEKREEKLRGETAGKRAEKQAQFRAMQQILDKRKAELASDNVRKNSLAKPQKSLKGFAQSANPSKESSKPAVVKKALSKASSTSAALRKSWPSTSSPQVTGTSLAKAISSTGPTPTLQKPQSASSVPRSTPKVERPQQRMKNTKASQNDASKSTNGATEKLQPLAKNGKTVKAEVQKKTTRKDLSVVARKPSLYSKVTKKSSVVPLESKPFLRKGSGLGPTGVGPVVVKAKDSSQLEEVSGNSGNPTQSWENEVVTNSSDPVNQQQEGNLEAPETHTELESEPELTSQKCDDPLTFEQVTSIGDDSFIREAKPVLKTEIEEVLDISPTAWVEIEEHQELLPVYESTCQITSSSNFTPLEMSYPRIRHSLSQMLLEESTEAEITEWGNAENPPAIVYQKDAPKGLKRLLKFARKSWAEPNVTGCSSSSGFYEGEDDAEESKTIGKKNADHLLRKDALYAKNYGQQKTSHGGYEKSPAGPGLLSAQSNMDKFSTGSSHKWPDHISAAATTTKAFRGSKLNGTKRR